VRRVSRLGIRNAKRVRRLSAGTILTHKARFEVPLISYEMIFRFID